MKNLFKAHSKIVMQLGKDWMKFAVVFGNLWKF